MNAYLPPNNTRVGIASDIVPAETKRLVETCSGSLPSGPEVAKIEPGKPVLAKSRHVTITSPTQAAVRAELIWTTCSKTASSITTSGTPP